MDFDEMKFKDEIELMNIQNQITRNQNTTVNSSYGFNLDSIYNEIEKNQTKL